jgi:hypothetical protein
MAQTLINDTDPLVRVERAAQALYDAEVNLHIARQTGVDRWIDAAYDRLHLAVVRHREVIAGAAADARRATFAC